MQNTTLFIIILLRWYINLRKIPASRKSWRGEGGGTPAPPTEVKCCGEGIVIRNYKLNEKKNRIKIRTQLLFYKTSKFCLFLALSFCWRKSYLRKNCFRNLTNEAEDCCYDFFKIGNFCKGRTTLFFRYLIRWSNVFLFNWKKKCRNTVNRLIKIYPTHIYRINFIIT